MYGILVQDTVMSGQPPPPSLISLDPALAGFQSDLQHLDALSCRSHHTVHVFYVKSGQKMPFEILSNVVSLKWLDVNLVISFALTVVG